MIEFSDLKAELLEKALTRHGQKDYSKLVLVLEEKKEDGKIKYQRYWKDPTIHTIDHHVKVLANHHLLPNGHPQKILGDGTTTVPIKRTKDEITHVADAYHDLFGNNEEFFEELQKRGITWKHSDDPKIVLMRSKMALKEAIKNGFNPFTKKNYKTAQPVKQEKPSEPVFKMDMKTPTTPESDKTANEYLKTTCGGDRQKFYENLKKMGVKWTEVPTNDGTNFMFAKRMFKLAIDQGLDPSSPEPKVVPKPVEQVKDEQPKKDESLLEVPSDATEREKNLIKFINQLTDIKDIQGCTRVGMVPEDRKSKSFIVDKLQVRIALAVMNPDNSDWFKSVDENGRKRFPQELRDAIKKSWGEDVLNELISRAGFGKDIIYDPRDENLAFGKAMADQLTLDGCKKSSITEGFKQAGNFDMAMLADPRSKIDNSVKAIKPAEILKSLNDGYSDYTSDAYSGEYFTNLGYTGFSPAEYKQRYSLDKEGVVKYLNKIKTENPQLKDKVDEMIKTYDETMKLVGCNPHVLNLVLSSMRWNPEPADAHKDNPKDLYKLPEFGKVVPKSYADAVRAVKYADHLSNLVIGELEKRGYSQQNILDALKDKQVNDGLKKFRIKNDNGGFDFIDFTQCKNPDGTNAVVVRRSEHEWGSGMLAYAQAKYMEKQNIPMNSVDMDNQKAMKTSLEFYDLAKQMSEVSEDTYKNVHKSILGMMGIKYVDSTGADLDYSTINMSKTVWKRQNIKPVKVDDNPATDMVLANMLYGKTFHDVNSAIAGSVTNNAKSKMNDDGKDYSKNFDYYSGSVMKDSTQRFTQLGNTEATCSASELSSKISKQLSQVPNLSAEYMAKLKYHYASTGKKPTADSFKSGWGKAATTYLDNPIKDVMYQLAENVSLHTPITVEKPTFSKLTAKRLNYVPYDFDLKSGNQPRLVKEKVKNPPPPPTPQDIKAARQKLLEAAHCSLGAMNEKETRDAWRKMLEEKMDYKKGDKTIYGTPIDPSHTIRNVDGTVDTTKSYDPQTDTWNQVLLLNEPLFKINNSISEENFNARQKKMMDNKVKEQCYTPIDVFTGTAYWSAANICGREGQFYTGSEIVKSGQMLGAGPYFALTLGKCCPYVGNESYNSRHADGETVIKNGKKVTYSFDKEQSDGIVIKSKIMMGERYVTNATASDVKNTFKTFLSRDASDKDLIRQYAQDKMNGVKPSFSVLRDVEMCGKDNNLICPELIMDTNSRVYGLNIIYDPETGYHDPVTGELTHDKYGVSVKIEWD